MAAAASSNLLDRVPSPKRYLTTFSRKQFGYQARQVALNVYANLRLDFPAMSYNDVLRRTSALTGVACSSILRWKKIFLEARPEDVDFISPVCPKSSRSDGFVDEIGENNAREFNASCCTGTAPYYACLTLLRLWLSRVDRTKVCPRFSILRLSNEVVVETSKSTSGGSQDTCPKRVVPRFCT